MKSIKSFNGKLTIIMKSILKAKIPQKILNYLVKLIKNIGYLKKLKR
jgi:hypothetical protein